MFPKSRYAWICMRKISIVYSTILWICAALPSVYEMAGFFLFQQPPLLNHVLCQIVLGFRYDLPMKPSGTQMSVILSLQLPRSCFNECVKMICMQNQIREASKQPMVLPQWCPCPKMLCNHYILKRPTLTVPNKNRAVTNTARIVTALRAFNFNTIMLDFFLHYFLMFHHNHHGNHHLKNIVKEYSPGICMEEI